MGPTKKQQKNNVRKVQNAKSSCTKSKTQIIKLKKPRKRISRRSVLKGAKTAWIYFCKERRQDILKKTPNMSFGDICKVLAPEWRSMNETEKKPYVDLHILDKKRYLEECSNLTEDQKKILRQHKRSKREEKRKKPKPALSPYMFFVINERKTLVTNNPTDKFQTIGKKLGILWNSMSSKRKKKYEEMSANDKIRFQQETAALSNKD